MELGDADLTFADGLCCALQVLIVEECMKTGGIGASLSAQINETYMDYLDAPVKPGKL